MSDGLEGAKSKRYMCCSFEQRKASTAMTQMPLRLAALALVLALAGPPAFAADDAGAPKTADSVEPKKDPATPGEGLNATDETKEAIDKAKDATIRAIEQAADAVKKALDKAKVEAGPAIEKAKKATNEAIDKAKKAANEVLDKAKEATNQTLDEAKEAAGGGKAAPPQETVPEKQPEEKSAPAKPDQPSSL